LKRTNQRRNATNATDLRKIGIAVERTRPVVEPQQGRRYTLDESLAQCNPKGRRTKEEKEWLDSKPVGRELI